MRLSHFYIYSILITLIGLSSSVSGQDIYSTSWKLEGSILGTSVGLFGAGLIIDNNRSPITVDRINNLNSNDIWGFDRSATFNFSTSAKDASDVFRDGIYLAPLTLFFSGKARSEYKPILLMYSEVIAFTGALTQITKGGVGRLRPYAYNQDTPLDLKLTTTTRRSFFSGHVSHVASLSFFTASVFSDLHPDSKYKYAVWAGAISAPAITGYLRYKAGRHFPSDVIVGYGVGAFVGYFIPKLHKGKIMSDLSIHGTNNGLGLSYIIK